MNKKDLPKVREFYHFFDDGKTSPNRHYICKVERIIPFNKAKNIILTTPRGEEIINELLDGKSYTGYFN